MKPNTKQQQVLKEVLSVTLELLNTNDIDSPSHYSEINEKLVLLELDGFITDEQQVKLTKIMRELLNEIQEIC